MARTCTVCSEPHATSCPVFDAPDALRDRDVSDGTVGRAHEDIAQVRRGVELIPPLSASKDGNAPRNGRSPSETVWSSYRTVTGAHSPPDATSAPTRSRSTVPPSRCSLGGLVPAHVAGLPAVAAALLMRE
jgi:hypothetical protein